MIIGVLKEVKDKEARVAVVPAGVKALVDAGHQVIVQTNAGELSSMANSDYVAAGATIADTAAAVWKQANMIVKVKEPIAQEVQYFRPGLVLFTYLHLAPIPDLTDELLKAKVTGIAYETVKDKAGALPLLTPMSEVAGRMSVQVGATFLEHEKGGRGILLGGVPGVPPAKVAILGGGIVGINAAKMALGLGAETLIIDLNLNRLRELDDIFNGHLRTLASNSYNIAHATAAADLVIGAVLIPGAQAPKLVTRDMVGKMKKGAVIVDVAIDQGGCIETAHPTTHSDPAFKVNGVVHYCVTNMPGAVPHTSTLALTNATFPYLMKIANHGAEEALKADPGLMQGLNTYQGKLTYEAVASAQNKKYVSADSAL